MPTDPHADDLIARLRAADPAAGLPDTGLDRAAVAAMRGRRASRRTLRLGGGGAVLAGAATLALALGPAGGGMVADVAPAPAVAQVVERAAAATRLTGTAIVAIESEVQVRALGDFTQRRTTWVRVGADGRQLAIRSLVTAATGRHVVAGVEHAMRRDDDGRTEVASFDPRSGRVTRSAGGSIEPSVVFQAERLLRLAQQGDRAVRLDRTIALDGRRAHVLTITGIDEPALAGDRSELVVDAETYAPLELRKHSEGIAVDGRPYTYDFRERVVEQRVLPDDAANRELLELRGPTG